MWSIIIGFVLSIAIALLTPKPKIEDAVASGLEDFSFPTVSESRNTTIVWGTRRISGPNVGAYANLKTIPIEESVSTGMFSSQDVTVGYRYYIDMALFLCFGEASLLQVDFGDFTAWTGRQDIEGAVNINKPFLFGYEDADGGIQGQLYFYPGTSTQASDPYLNANIRQQPGFKGICYGVWRGGWIGNSVQVKPLSFVIERFSNPLGRPSTEYDINGDANPAFCLYEILNSDFFGKGYGTDLLDNDSFIAAAQTLYSEGMGVSMVFDQKTDINNIVQQLEQHINGNLYFDPQSGKIKLNLVRQDYVIDDLPLLDESNIKDVRDYTKGGATNLVTEVKVRYIDRSANFKDRVAPAPDTGTRQMLGRANARTLDYFGFSNATIAGKVALRDLLPLGAYMATVNVTTNRDASEFYPGQPVRFVWSPLGISQLIMRVKALNIGKLTDGKVTLSLVEDAFAVSAAVFDPNPDSGWTPINSTPAEIINHVALDVPYWFQQTAEPYKIMWLAEENNGDSKGYNVWERNVTLAESNYTQITQSSNYTSLAQIAVALDKENTVTLELKQIGPSFGLTARTLTEILQTGLNTMLIYNTNGDHEFIAFEDFNVEVSGNYTFSGVQRGMLDTVARDFAADTFVWFMSNIGAGLLTFNATDSIAYRLQSITGLGVFDISTISDTAIIRESRQARPYPPGRFYVNGFEWPGIIATGTINLTWAHRERSIDLLQTQDDNTGTLEASTTYTIEFRNQASTLIRTVTGLTGTSYSYPNATEQADNGGNLADPLNIQIYAVGPSLNSKFVQERSVARS